MSFWELFFKKDKQPTRTLEEYLNDGKDIEIVGVKFRIRRLNAMDYLEGARVIHEIFSTYEQKREREKISKQTVQDLEKAKSYFTDVICAGVIEPKIVRKEEEDGIWINRLFDDWFLAQKLTEEILLYTYGKKK